MLLQNTTFEIKQMSLLIRNEPKWHNLPVDWKINVLRITSPGRGGKLSGTMVQIHLLDADGHPKLEARVGLGKGSSVLAFYVDFGDSSHAKLYTDISPDDVTM